MAASARAAFGDRAVDASPTSRHKAFQFNRRRLQACASDCFGSQTKWPRQFNVSRVAAGSILVMALLHLSTAPLPDRHDGAIAGSNVVQTLKRWSVRPLSLRRQFPLRLDALRHLTIAVKFRRRHRGPPEESASRGPAAHLTLTPSPRLVFPTATPH